MVKLSEREQARKMRKEGKSLSEIANLLDVSKSSVSLWVKNIQLSAEAQKRIDSLYTKAQLKSQETRRVQTRKKKQKIINDISDIVSSLVLPRDHRLLLCSLIYWCEGSSNENGRVAFTNSDPDLVKLFLDLLRNTFELDEKKFRICMHLHSYHNEMIQKRFWSRLTGISTRQFTKTYHKKNTSKRTKESYQGCISVRYYDVDIARRLITLAKLFMKNHKGVFVNW